MSTATMVFTLSGPAQAWGTGGAGVTRHTDGHPSKSGVMGLLAAALGRDRSADLSDLFALDFAVRVDVAGRVVADYQAVRKRVGDLEEQFPVATDGRYTDQQCQRAAVLAHRLMVEPEPFVTPPVPANVAVGEYDWLAPQRTKGAMTGLRYYLCDAVFTVAVTGDEELLAGVARALVTPVYPLYLGRRNCPAEPIVPEFVGAGDPVSALAEYRYQGVVPGSDSLLRDGSRGVPDTVPVIADAGLVSSVRGVTSTAADVVVYRQGHRRDFVARPTVKLPVATVTDSPVEPADAGTDSWGVLT